MFKLEEDVLSNTILKNSRLASAKPSEEASKPSILNIEEDVSKTFVTGSSYKGEWSALGMEGKGRYLFPHNVIYEGSFKNGEFHGEGVLKYPGGQILKGEWRDGKLIKWLFSYKDIEDWTLNNYCQPPDRRFYLTLRTGLKCAPNENLSNHEMITQIPEECYDVNDGYYRTKTEWVHSRKNLDKILYLPPGRELNVEVTIYKPDGTSFVKKVPNVLVYKDSKWIESSCRKSFDAAVGYRPELYESWFSGRKSELEEVNSCIKSKYYFKKPSACDDLLAFFKNYSERQYKVSFR